MNEVAFGVRLPIGGSLPSVEAIRRIGLEAERLDFASVYARDNLLWSTKMQMVHVSEGASDILDERSYSPDHYEATVVFSYLASITQKIRFVYSIVCLAFRNPIVTAKQIATLDVMSNGRVDVGIAPGGWKIAYDVFGIPYKERGAIADEAFYAMKEIWTKKSASFSGKYFHFEDLVQYPKPIQKPYPRIMYGALAKPHIIRRVAEFCDGWMPTWGSPEDMAEGKRKMQEKAKEFGRSFNEFPIHYQVSACVARTDEEAWDKAKLTMVKAKGDTMKDGSKATDARYVIDRTLIGSPSRIIKQVEHFSEAGVTDFEFLFIYKSIDDLVEQMNLVAREVAPSFTMRKSR